MTIESINPATGQPIKTYTLMENNIVRQSIAAAHKAQVKWRKLSFDKRAVHLKAAARVLRDNADRYSRLMAEEMGKPIQQGRSEVEKCAWVCEFYADQAVHFLKPEPVEMEGAKSFVTFQPLGVVLAVMPWNFPFWQVFRFAAPALMAGNAGLLKHASNVPGSALAIEDIFREAGLPEHLFQTLLINNKQVKTVIRHKRVVAVTLTGSTGAGQAIGQAAGKLLKKTVLELGGSDPYLILEDADLDQAVEACATSRLINSGQSCIAAKRFIVVPSQQKAFEEKLVQRMKAATMGDPLQEETKVGPLARPDLRDDLHRQVQESVQAGARCLLGGQIPAGPGAFYPPTVLTDVKKGMTAYQEELFGPVAAIIPAKHEREAIKIANDSVFGLGAAVFTRDLAKGEKIAATQLEAGCCFVNDFVKSDPRLPFGGIKESGFGRELSHYGIKEFTNIKTVYLKL